jgi:hypothetical protein
MGGLAVRMPRQLRRDPWCVFEELDVIRQQLEEMDNVIAISPEVRAIVERNWPHLLAKLLPDDE